MSWQLATVALLVLVLAGFGWYELRRPSAKVLALVASLAALAVIGRLAFAAIPNVKPSTDIVLFAGYALGAVPGFVVGAVFALVSNFFLGQGPWTVWQMAGWGGVGVGGALLARWMHGRAEPGRLRLALACGAAGLAFGAWMDVYQWTLAARQDLGSYLAVSGSSLPYNLAHAIGNVAFCLLIGPVFVRALARYRRRFEVRWPAPAPAAAGAAALVLVALLALPAALATASPASRAQRYLERSQNADGGFGSARGQSSNQLHTGWAALGLAAAGQNPRDVSRRGGRSIASYVRRGAGSIRSIGELERTVLVLRAAGIAPETFAGRNLIREILARRRADGSFAGFTSYTSFGVLALRAAGKRVGKRTAGWLTRAQNGDGGFGVSPASASDADMTGVGLQALAAIGRSRGRAARRAVAWLREAQNRDGGFSLSKGGDSNTQSTAYAVTGLVAVAAAKDVTARGLEYIRARQRSDGSVAYSATSNQTPVWVTAQALLALRRVPLPLVTVPRKPRAASTGGGKGGGATSPGSTGGGRSGATTGGGSSSGSGSGGSGSGASGSGSGGAAATPGGPDTPVDSGSGTGGAGVPSALPPGAESATDAGADGPAALELDRAGEEDTDAPSPVLLVGGGAGALLAVWFGRRRLRRLAARLSSS